MEYSKKRTRGEKVWEKKNTFLYLIIIQMQKR